MTDKAAMIAEITPDPNKQRLLDSLEKPMGGVGRALLENVAKVSDAVDASVKTFRAARDTQASALTAMSRLIPASAPQKSATKKAAQTPLMEETGKYLGDQLQKKTRDVFAKVDALVTKPLPSADKRQDNTPNIEQRGAARPSLSR